MPTITTTLPEGWTVFQVAIEEDSAGELVSSICERYGYSATVDGEENPESPNGFANRMVREKYLAPLVVSYRAKQAASQPLPEMTSATGVVS